MHCDLWRLGDFNDFTMNFNNWLVSLRSIACNCVYLVFHVTCGAFFACIICHNSRVIHIMWTLYKCTGPQCCPYVCACDSSIELTANVCVPVCMDMNAIAHSPIQHTLAHSPNHRVYKQIPNCMKSSFALEDRCLIFVRNVDVCVCVIQRMRKLYIIRIYYWQFSGVPHHLLNRHMFFFFFFDSVFRCHAI